MLIKPDFKTPLTEDIWVSEAQSGTQVAFEREMSLTLVSEKSVILLLCMRLNVLLSDLSFYLQFLEIQFGLISHSSVGQSFF